MNNLTPKKADLYFKTSRNLECILSKIKELDELHNKISIYLHPNIRAYCHVANLMGHRLIMIVANGSIATQLRFQTPDLIALFRKDPLLQKIKEIHCKVYPPLVPLAQIKTEPMSLLSAETAEIISEIANSLTDDKLSQIMKKIAGHRAETK